MKKLDIKRITLSLLYYPGLFLLVLLGHISVEGFVLSAIPLVLAYVLAMIWYGKKRANIYGIVMLIVLGIVFLLSFIVPLLDM